MKKVILWLIKVFRVDIPTEKIVEVEKVVEKEIKVPTFGQDFDGTIEGDLIVKGHVIVKGNLFVTKGICCYKQSQVEFEYKEGKEV